MTFMWLALVVLSLLLPQFSAGTEGLLSPAAPLGVIGCVVAWGLLGKVNAIRIAAAYDGGQIGAQAAIQQILIWRERLLAIWCLMLPIVMLNLHWGDIGNWAVVTLHSQSLAMLVWLMPTIAVACLLTGAVVQLKRFIANEIAIPEDQPAENVISNQWPEWILDARHKSFWAQAWHEGRHYANSTWLLLLMPVFLIGVSADTISLLVPDWHQEWWSHLVWVSLLMIVGSLFPHWIAMTWKTVSLPSSIHDRISQLITSTGSGRIKVELWPSGQSISNAMVVGWWSFNRKLIVSEGLLGKLSPSELDLVCLHELAHVRRGHLWLRLVALIPAAAVAFGCWKIDQIFFGTLGGASHSVSHLVFQAGCAGAIVSLFFGSLRGVAHWTELDADRWAVELACLSGHGGSNTPSKAAGALICALENLTGKNPRSRRSTWLHPSIDCRVQRLHNRFRQA